VTDLVSKHAHADATARRPALSPLVHLRRDGVSLIVELEPAPAFDPARPGLPTVLHWGADLGPVDDGLRDVVAAVSRQTLPGTLDAAWQASILPVEGDAWAGRPGLSVTRRGVPLHPRWSRIASRLTSSKTAG